MSLDPFLGEIKIFAGNFAIQGHALCNGALLAISQNVNLFALLGTTYGGDGINTFGLPDLRGRVPIHMGTGTGLTPRTNGETGGIEEVTLTINQLPAHTHPMNANPADGNSTNPANNFWAAQPALGQYAPANTAGSNLKTTATTPAGGSQPHENLQPYLALNYIIALEGIYPS